MRPNDNGGPRIRVQPRHAHREEGVEVAIAVENATRGCMEMSEGDVCKHSIGHQGFVQPGLCTHQVSCTHCNTQEHVQG